MHFLRVGSPLAVLGGPHVPGIERRSPHTRQAACALDWLTGPRCTFLSKHLGVSRLQKPHGQGLGVRQGRCWHLLCKPGPALGPGGGGLGCFLRVDLAQTREALRVQARSGCRCVEEALLPLRRQLPPTVLLVPVGRGKAEQGSPCFTGDGACVLLRALEPLEGQETMRQLRSTHRKSTASRALKDRELCSGPSKLCQALAVDKSFDQRDLARDEAMWLECSPPAPQEPAVVAAARVGIGHAGEWTQKPLRFYVRGSPWVSVVDRAAEKETPA